MAGSIIKFHFTVTPCGFWPQRDDRDRFSYLEEEGKLSEKRRACILDPCQAEMASWFTLVRVIIGMRHMLGQKVGRGGVRVRNRDTGSK